MLLEHMENDFSEAREILKDYLKDEIPPVRISTCFSDNSGTAQTWDAYYYNPNVGIRLYKGWDQAATSLLHEYIYLHRISFGIYFRQVQHRQKMYYFDLYQKKLQGDAR